METKGHLKFQQHSNVADLFAVNRLNEIRLMTERRVSALCHKIRQWMGHLSSL